MMNPRDITRSRQHSWSRGAAFLVAALACVTARTATMEVRRPPNVVLIFADDLGYGDIGCYGRQDIRTPHLDRLAREGVRFTDFSVAQAVCSASRAALLTGCLPNRVGILGALYPRSPIGIHPNEVTLGELFQSRGYGTAIVGKWHLGDAPAFNPTRHGFDEWLGLPYSNDMWPHHPTLTNFPPLPLMDGTAVVNADVGPEDQETLTSRYTARAVDFIRRQGSTPFFLYLAHSMPHVPIFASPKFRGRSAGGLYGDVIEEIDDSVGAIVAALRASGVERDTVVIFTSDNGPWLSYGAHAGVTGGFREGKGTAWEGGMRVPMIACWPGQIPAGRVHTGFASTVDLFPTLAALIDAPLPSNRALDGRNIVPALMGSDASVDEGFIFPEYYGANLCSVRSGSWKRVYSHRFQHLDRAGSGGLPGAYVSQPAEAALYDLTEDPAETKDVAKEHPEVVARLDAEAVAVRGALGDGIRGIKGGSARPPGSTAALGVVQSADGTVLLRATNAIVHGVELRFDPDPARDCLEPWTRLKDWVEWDFELERSGRYEIELTDSCADDGGGAEVELRVNGQTLRHAMNETGGSDRFAAHTVGVVDFAAPGHHTLELRARTKPSATVGAIRSILIRPHH